MHKKANTRNVGVISIALIIILLLIDQLTKIEIKLGMTLYETINITDWCKIVFVENNGMAYGLTFFNKYVLSIFRLIFICVISIFIAKQIKKGARIGFILCVSTILAGAIGNMIDCLFYGLIFTESTPHHVASLVNFGEGYSNFLTGKVVDMFHFPLIDTFLPSWLPIWGGKHFLFFSPVFNFADSCISVGMVWLLLFYRKELHDLSYSLDKKKTQDDKK